jgi:DNA-binding CsgD family transcriptional regulator
VVATTARILAGGNGDALPDFARAAEEASEDGNSRIVTLAAIHHSHALTLLGRPEAAAEEARAGVTRAADLGLSDHRLVLLGNLGEALVECGRLSDADDALSQAAAGWRELGREAPSPVDPARARLLLARGLITDALREYRSIAANLGHDPLFEQVAPAAAGHALAAAVAGEARESERMINRCLTTWRRTDDRLAVVPLLVVGATMGAGDAQDRCADALADLATSGVESARLFATGDPVSARGLRRAAERLSGAGLAWWANRLRFVAGNLGDDDDAIEDLHLARREFRQMGADGWRLRSEAALRARGQRIPSRAEGRPTEANVLSAREMEVLAHLSLGLRNREIGDELFIAERTVARHVGKILAKLEVPTRTAAVRVARERGLLPETII